MNIPAQVLTLKAGMTPRAKRRARYWFAFILPVQYQAKATRGR